MTWKLAPAPSIPRPRVRSGRSRGRQPSSALAPARRPFGENPNRLQHYYQFRSSSNRRHPISRIYLKSLAAIGIDSKIHDIRFFEDDGKAPRSAPGDSAGNAGAAWGASSPISSKSRASNARRSRRADLAERLAMYVQGVDNVFALNFNGREGAEKISYGDVFCKPSGIFPA